MAARIVERAVWASLAGLQHHWGSTEYPSQEVHKAITELDPFF